MRGNFISVHIADEHFGSMDPLKEYQILKEQFLYPISQLPRIDLISLNGDLTDRKFLASSDAIRYAVQFVDNVVQLSKEKHATVIILKGTDSHSAGNIKLFYHYLEDPTIDVRIVETIKFEYIQGANVLCIPELYTVDEKIYQHFFHGSGWYDMVVAHGTYNGAVYGNNVGQGRLFTKEDFSLCRGPAIAGHVHKPGCFDKFWHYSGSPMRYKFGEEEAKGYLICNQDLDTGIFYVEFEEITSFRYDTIYLDQLVSEDPRLIIEYINNLKREQGIDFIRVRFRCDVTGANRTIINNYYRNTSNVTIEFNDSIDMKNETQLQSAMQSNDKYSYLNDNSLSDYERFVRFVNESEGSTFITVDQLTELLSTKEL